MNSQKQELEEVLRMPSLSKKKWNTIKQNHRFLVLISLFVIVIYFTFLSGIALSNFLTKCSQNNLHSNINSYDFNTVNAIYIHLCEKRSSKISMQLKEEFTRLEITFKLPVANSSAKKHLQRVHQKNEIIEYIFNRLPKEGFDKNLVLGYYLYKYHLNYFICLHALVSKSFVKEETSYAEYICKGIDYLISDTKDLQMCTEKIYEQETLLENAI